LSEDAACNRIHAARACRRFPVIVDMLAAGTMSLTSVRLLREHLTPENREAVLARAAGLSRRQIEALVAELAPRPDVPSSVRKLRTVAPPPPPVLTSEIAPPSPTLTLATTPSAAQTVATVVPSVQPERPMGTPAPAVPTRRPIIETTSPERYRVQFTVGKETHDKLRSLQALLRREIPDGDPGAIFDRAVTLLLEKVEKAKLGSVARPRSSRSTRPGTDKTDGGQCGFVSPDGQRCRERGRAGLRSSGSAGGSRHHR
jgi:hypothetical protein